MQKIISWLMIVLMATPGCKIPSTTSSTLATSEDMYMQAAKNVKSAKVELAEEIAANNMYSYLTIAMLQINNLGTVQERETQSFKGYVDQANYYLAEVEGAVNQTSLDSYQTALSAYIGYSGLASHMTHHMSVAETMNSRIVERKKIFDPAVCVPFSKLMDVKNIRAIPFNHPVARFNDYTKYCSTAGAAMGTCRGGDNGPGVLWSEDPVGAASGWVTLAVGTVAGLIAYAYVSGLTFSAITSALTFSPAVPVAGKVAVGGAVATEASGPGAPVVIGVVVVVIAAALVADYFTKKENERRRKEHEAKVNAEIAKHQRARDWFLANDITQQEFQEIGMRVCQEQFGKKEFLPSCFRRRQLELCSEEHASEIWTDDDRDIPRSHTPFDEVCNEEVLKQYLPAAMELCRDSQVIANKNVYDVIVATSGNNLAEVRKLNQQYADGRAKLNKLLQDHEQKLRSVVSEQMISASRAFAARQAELRSIGMRYNKEVKPLLDEFDDMMFDDAPCGAMREKKVQIDGVMDVAKLAVLPEYTADLAHVLNGISAIKAHMEDLTKGCPEAPIYDF